jgi:hypothetical protein
LIGAAERLDQEPVLARLAFQQCRQLAIRDDLAAGDDVAIGSIGISTLLGERSDAMGEQHRRLGCDHHGTEAGARHDQALIHQDPQRLRYRLAAWCVIGSVSVGNNSPTG